MLNDYDYTNQARFGSTSKLSSGPTNYHPRSVFKVSVNREALFSECKPDSLQKPASIALKSISNRLRAKLPFTKKNTHTHTQTSIDLFLLRYSVRYHRCCRHSRPPSDLWTHVQIWRAPVCAKPFPNSTTHADAQHTFTAHTTVMTPGTSATIFPVGRTYCAIHDA